MEFKRCSRCGCFYVSNTNVCEACLPKDNLEISKLKNYFADNEIVQASVDSISINTGISVKNVNRYLNLENFSDIQIKL